MILFSVFPLEID